MPENISPNPMHEKYPDLHKSEFVEKAASHHEATTGEALHQPAEKIDAWMQTLERIHIGRDEATAQRIKDVYHRQFVIKPEDVPESYFDLQKRIAREQGHGNLEIPDNVRTQMADTIAKDQERSLDNWVDYLSSPDAAYPMWFKYYTFRNITKLSEFDKEKGEFRKRSKSTTAPFPDLNREALAYVADSLTSHYKIDDKKPEGAGVEIDPTTKQLLDQDTGFAKLYAHAIEKIHPASAEELSSVDGRWVKYDKGSDAAVLSSSLQGHGTGWCTAGEGTAEAQLNAGDFYVFYTQSANDDYTVPRVAIRMGGDEIAEVRGIQSEQNLEPALIAITQDKMSELPGAEEYEKKTDDMRRLTDIEARASRGDDLNAEDLRFLYEFKEKIEGFGYQGDPRIREIVGSRKFLADMEIIYGSSDVNDILDGLINDDALFNEFERLKWALEIDDNTLTKRIIEKGQAQVVIDNIDSLRGLDQSVFLALLQAGLDQEEYEMMRSFSLTREEISSILFNSRQVGKAIQNFELPPDVDPRELANRLIDNGQGMYVLDNIVKFTGVSGYEVVRSIIDTGRAVEVIDRIGDIAKMMDDGIFSNAEYDAILAKLDAEGVEQAFDDVEHDEDY